MGNVLGLYLALALVAVLPGAALPAPARVAALDPARIHADYQAGEFEKVIRALEAFRESGRRCRKADSVFLEKHLAVVYAADPKTRERGRYHMLRMLTLEPEADLLDMFVGEEVDGIFEKVRKESRARRMALAKARPSQAPQVPKRAATRSAALPRSAAAPHTGSVPVPKPALHAARPAVPAAGVPRPAFPEAGPAPRLKPWNLEDSPAPRRAPRRPGASRAAAVRETDAAGASGTELPKAAMPATALPAWDLDRTAASGPALGVLPEAGARQPLPQVRASMDKPASLDFRSRRPRPEAVSELGSPDSAARAEAGPASRPRWARKRFLVGGTAVAAVLGLTAYYVGSQDWSEPASRTRTYGVAAKPNGN